MWEPSDFQNAAGGQKCGRAMLGGTGAMRCVDMRWWDPFEVALCNIEESVALCNSAGDRLLRMTRDGRDASIDRVQRELTTVGRRGTARIRRENEAISTVDRSLLAYIQ